MSEVEALKIAHGQLAEHVIEDRGGVFDGIVALHRSRRLETRESEGVHIFLERYAVLQAERNRDRKIVQ